MDLSLAYSTDLDDAFMFWALRDGHLDPAAYGFQSVGHVCADTATLNAWAAEGRHDVVAVSVAALPALIHRYALLPHGGSLGRGYGPVVVSKRRDLDPALAGLRVGVPGSSTTCARLVSLAAPAALQVAIPSAPLERAFSALEQDEVDACALIHEGRLLFRTRGFEPVIDLGQFWEERVGLPLPLGGNVIRRALGEDAVRRADRMIKDSIAFALQHREAALDALCPARPQLERSQADAYLRLYANEDTLDYGADGRAAIARLLPELAPERIWS
jgi:1,4-dihydroxy-6-naphthoate synthase